MPEIKTLQGYSFNDTKARSDLEQTNCCLETVECDSMEFREQITITQLGRTYPKSDGTFSLSSYWASFTQNQVLPYVRKGSVIEYVPTQSILDQVGAGYLAARMYSQPTMDSQYLISQTVQGYTDKLLTYTVPVDGYIWVGVRYTTSNATNSIRSEILQTAMVYPTFYSIPKIKTDSVISAIGYTPANDETTANLLSQHTAEISKQLLAIQNEARKVHALFSMSEGKEYQIQTDSTEAYNKAVLNGSVGGTIDSFGGKSIVWNQIQPQTNNRTNYGITFAYDSEKCVVGISGTSTATAYWITSSQSRNIRLKAGHILYSEIGVLSGTYTHYFNALYDDGTKNTSITGAFATKFYTVEKDGYAYLQIKVTSDITVDISIPVWIVDLTEMFGIGNEPTDEFDERIIFVKSYIAQHSEYNSGEIIHADVTEIISEGANVFNKDDQTNIQGAYSSDKLRYGYIITPTENMTAKTYGYSTNADNPVAIFQVNDDNTLSYLKALSTSSSIGSAQKLSPGVKYFIGATATSKNILLARTAQMKLMINRGDIAMPYAEYTADTFTIPDEIRSLTGYGWSAGAVSNIVDWENKAFIQNVDRIDLGTLDWAAESSSGISFYNVSFELAEITSSTKNGNILCPLYLVRAAGVSNGSDDGISIWNNKDTNAGSIRIFDSTVSSVDSLKTKLSGVYMYYAMRTPVSTSISSLIDDNNFFYATTGGSLTFKQASTKLPVPNTESMCIKLSEVST